MPSVHSQSGRRTGEVFTLVGLNDHLLPCVSQRHIRKQGKPVRRRCFCCEGATGGTVTLSTKKGGVERRSGETLSSTYVSGVSSVDTLQMSYITSGASHREHRSGELVPLHLQVSYPADEWQRRSVKDSDCSALRSDARTNKGQKQSLCARIYEDIASMRDRAGA